MEYLHALILGVVQGVAEFLPVSSSGHLVIADAILRDTAGLAAPRESVTMEIALHFGTLLSILVVFREDLLKLLKNRRLMMMIVVATIPVGVVGLAFKSVVESAFRSPLLAGCALIITAGFLVVGRWLQKPEGKDLTSVSGTMATAIGVFQAIAIVPGISRSGSTIAAGMACGLNRPAAARFSFLIALPAIGGATVLQLKKILLDGEAFTSSLGAVALGTIVAFIVGLLSLKWLLKVVVADRLHYFGIYCLIAGGATTIWQLAKS